MLENWQDNCKPGVTMNISRNTSMTSNEEASRLTYKLVRVEGDVTLAPASEDEVMEVEHLLAEPKHEKVSVDGLLCFDIENPEKCLEIDDFPDSVDHNQIKIDNGTYGSTTTRDWNEESKFEFLDRMLQGVDEEYLLETNGLSSACDDYLLDTGFDEKVSDVDYGPCEGSGSGNLGFESHFTGLSERDPGGAATLELPPTTAPMPESKSDQNDLLLDKMTIHELHEVFRSTFGRETLVKDKQWLIRRISSRVQNLVQSEDVTGFLESGISSRENGGDMRFTSCNDSPRVFCSSTVDLSNRGKPVNQSVVRERLVGVDVSKTSSSKASGIAFGLLNSRDKEDAPSARKRLRKPTRRYIEESSDMRSRHYSRRLESPISNSGTKYMLSRSYNQHQRKGSDLQVPFDPQRRKRHPKTNTSIWDHGPGDKNDIFISDPNPDSDLEPSPAESHDDMSDHGALTKRNVKGGIRRKHHRLWSLSEVMKLIDGVSQYGVGRWTDIKRLLFSSSAYRTSVDLKDKWRNLLRASGTPFKKKREVEQVRKSPSRPIPQSVLRRVSELAIIYPYPRDRKSKLTRSSLVATPIPVAASSDTTVSQSGRTIHRKSIT